MRINPAFTQYQNLNLRAPASSRITNSAASADEESRFVDCNNVDFGYLFTKIVRLGAELGNTGGLNNLSSLKESLVELDKLLASKAWKDGSSWMIPSYRVLSPLGAINNYLREQGTHAELLAESSALTRKIIDGSPGHVAEDFIHPSYYNLLAQVAKTLEPVDQDGLEDQIFSYVFSRGMIRPLIMNSTEIERGLAEAKEESKAARDLLIQHFPEASDLINKLSVSLNTLLDSQASGHEQMEMSLHGLVPRMVDDISKDPHYGRLIAPFVLDPFLGNYILEYKFRGSTLPEGASITRDSLNKQDFQPDYIMFARYIASKSDRQGIANMASNILGMHEDIDTVTQKTTLMQLAEDMIRAFLVRGDERGELGANLDRQVGLEMQRLLRSAGLSRERAEKIYSFDDKGNL